MGGSAQLPFGQQKKDYFCCLPSSGHVLRCKKSAGSTSFYVRLVRDLMMLTTGILMDRTISLGVCSRTKGVNNICGRAATTNEQGRRRARPTIHMPYIPRFQLCSGSSPVAKEACRRDEEMKPPVRQEPLPLPAGRRCDLCVVRRDSAPKMKPALLATRVQPRSGQTSGSADSVSMMSPACSPYPVSKCSF